LQHLEGNDIGQGCITLKVAKVTANKSMCMFRSTGSELAKGFVRHVESQHIEASIDQGHIVATIAAAHVETYPTHCGRVCPQCCKDVIDERQRSFAPIASCTVFSVPALGVQSSWSHRVPTFIN